MHRHAQLGARATQSNAPVLDGHDRHFALAPQLARDRFPLDGVQRRLRAHDRIVPCRTEWKRGFESRRQAVGGSVAQLARAHRQLRKTLREVPAPRGDDVAGEITEREPDERHTLCAPDALDVPLDPRRESSRIRERAQPHSGGRVSEQGRARITLAHRRVHRRTVRQPDRQRAFAIQDEAEAAARTAFPEVAGAGVEIDVAKEGRPGGSETARWIGQDAPEERLIRCIPAPNHGLRGSNRTPVTCLEGSSRTAVTRASALVVRRICTAKVSAVGSDRTSFQRRA